MQLHWIDLLLAELACMLLWLNPIAFLYKRSIKLQHEYLADSYTIKGGVDIPHYLECLLTRLKLENHSGVISQFYSQSIKRRIIMVTKTKTASGFSVAYLLLIPAALMLLFAFSNKPGEPFANALHSTAGGQNIPSIVPVEVAKVTHITVYGNRMHPVFKKIRFHTGIDFEMTEGEPVRSTADGTVVKFINEYGRGNYVIVKHSDTYSTSYSHLQSAIVKEGETITKGQVIGYVGSTGISTGPHLHYEVMKDGQFVDPKDYLPN
jgi:murein DD-endopeptidase MepM/ murein hydrolase activator NlpD